MSGHHTKYRIAIFASGSGSNAEAIMKYFAGHENISVALLLSNNKEAPALLRAEKLGVATKIFTAAQFRETGEVLRWLQEAQVTHVVLAGFLWLIPESFIRAFPNAIINIHPSLLPKFSGKGMYGMKVHTAVKDAGELETGITIHEVNEHYDEGKILFQAQCPLSKTDTTENIAAKVHALEHRHYPEVIANWLTGA